MAGWQQGPGWPLVFCLWLQWAGSEVRPTYSMLTLTTAEAFQEGKLGLDLGKSLPTNHSLAIFKDTEVPVREGMQANLSGCWR